MIKENHNKNILFKLTNFEKMYVFSQKTNMMVFFIITKLLY